MSSIIYKAPNLTGAMAELVDALVLGTSIVRCEGSSPFHGTYGNFIPRCNNFGSFSIICY